MTTIGLIRHGITEWNVRGLVQGVSDIPLHDIGRKQALDVANRLAQEEPWDILITSDLSRAVETGEIIQSQLNIPTSFTDPQIREINCGQIEGTNEEIRVAKWGEKWRDLDLGIEKFAVVGKRGVSFMEHVVKTYSGKRILVVSHGTFIGITLKQLLPEKFQKTMIDNTSLTIIKNTNNTWDCELYNCTKHLKREI
ncbi:histidine phosphatase family protein [Alkalihalobacterium chitinilyticum]|uniref:Histidine phosphatase family protein n=1 Tax=Alkalihalobacterium chitinilyticum TaxID=2980103 RepID=A0ABT5VFI5_9BACI|nr:histidine phosphatase family protein [Alkalihalobacterium chitinilyticum]MDE5413218.1 histidine phosphatase family protein [Alkalihalobacterium chitinilyticum]